MRALHFLGTRGEVEELKDREYSSLELILDNNSIIFDLGSIRHLERIEKLPLALIFTHAHKDHVNKDALLKFVQSWPEAKILMPARILRGKHGESLRRFLEEEKIKHLTESSLEIAGIRIEAFPVQHSVLAPTVAYRISNRLNLLYAPDFLDFPERYWEDLDYAILDGSTLGPRDIVRISKKDAGKRIGHKSMIHSLELAKKAGVKNVIFTHIGLTVMFGKHPSLEETEKAVKEIFDKVEIAEDDQIIPLSSFKLASSLQVTNSLVLEKKYDGAYLTIHKSEDRVEILTDRGLDRTDRFPITVKELLGIEHPKRFIIGVETEIWEDGKHFGREEVGAFMMRKDGPPDTNVVHNAFDCMYFWDDQLEKHDLNLKAGDIHKLPYLTRRKYLALLPFKQSTEGVPDVKKSKLNLIPYHLVETESEMAEELRRILDLPHSEGVMIKTPDHPYELDGISRNIWKFKTYFEAHVIVWKRFQTKVPTVFNYFIAIAYDPDDNVDPKQLVEVKGKTYLKAGKTYATTEKVEPGEIISIVAHNFTRYIDRHGLTTVNFYEPIYRGRRPEQNVPDSLKEVIQNAKAGRAYKEKREEQEAKEARETALALLFSYQKGYPVEPYLLQEDPFLQYPKEDLKLRYVVQLHARGKSTHKDLRLELLPGELLIGWTLTDAIKGAVKEVIDTLDKARALMKDPTRYFKLDWKTGLPLYRIKKGQVKPTFVSILAMKKAPEPIEWLTFEGITEPGEVGATAEHKGVFLIVDKGRWEAGAQKVWSHEYFFSKGVLQDKYLFRRLRFPRAERLAEAYELGEESYEEAIIDLLKEMEEAEDLDEFFISSDREFLEDYPKYKLLQERIRILPPAEEGEEEVGWVMIKPLDNTPYVLTKPAVDKKWMPPVGFSALPQVIRDQIPPQYQYWKRVTEAEARSVRDKLYNEIKAGRVKLEIPEIRFQDESYQVESQQIESSHENQQDESQELEKAFRAELTYQWHWWRGRKLIRAGVSEEHWDLRIDFGEDAKPRYIHWVCEQDLRKVDATSAYTKPMKDPEEAMVKGGTEEEPEYLEPRTDWNPTKATPAFLVIYEKRLPITVFQRTNTFIKFRAEGKQLSGLFVAIREDMSEWWKIERTESIG